MQFNIKLSLTLVEACTWFSSFSQCPSITAVDVNTSYNVTGRLRVRSHNCVQLNLDLTL